MKDKLYSGINDELLVVRFGAEDGQDIDLLVVSRHSPYHQQLRLGNLDLTILPEHTVLNLAQLHDLLVAISFRTGRVIAGDQAVFQHLQETLDHPSSLQQVVAHHLEQALRCCSAAKSFQTQAYESCASPYAELCASSVGWAASYLIAARHYSELGSVIGLTLSDLLKQPGGTILQQAREIGKRCRVNPEAIESSELRSLVGHLDSLLLHGHTGVG